MIQIPVLICGAGPTGLVLAIWLTKSGVPVRIVDAADKAGTTSRATVVHARTLEFYHQLGIAQRVLDQGIEFRGGRLWVGGRQKVHFQFSLEGQTITPYPFIYIFPQDLHERMLEEELGKLGVRVERGVRLTSFQEHADGIQAELLKPDGSSETCGANYLAGCDGAHSVVRHTLGIPFRGDTYQNLFYVADLRISGPLLNGDLNAAVEEADFLLIFPMKGEGRVRLIGAMKQKSGEKGIAQWSDVSDEIFRRVQMNVEEVYWFSTYHVHHRVAERFQAGRAFLLGDAGHIHSPVGGQGMNTGIGDAVNLAWKLAAVLKDGAPISLLDTYSQERRGFARQLVGTTDRVFTFVDKRSALATFIRVHIVPWLVRLAFKIPFFRRFAFLTVSQTRISYRKSKLSRGGAGSIQAGDRLPWLPQDPVLMGEADNFAPLGCLCWQLHCYGQPSAAVQQLARSHGIPLCVFPVNTAALKAGFRKDALYLVRPDGYVGLALAPGDTGALKAYLEQWKIGDTKKPPERAALVRS